MSIKFWIPGYYGQPIYVLIALWIVGNKDIHNNCKSGFSDHGVGYCIQSPTRTLLNEVPLSVVLLFWSGICLWQKCSLWNIHECGNLFHTTGLIYVEFHLPPISLDLLDLNSTVLSGVLEETCFLGVVKMFLILLLSEGFDRIYRYLMSSPSSHLLACPTVLDDGLQQWGSATAFGGDGGRGGGSLGAVAD